MEAGHRCAIPTRKKTSIKIALIVPYRDEKSHSFENPLGLCAT
jgi:hypothetical protein